MKAKDLFKQERALRVLVYGQTGSGKTTWATASPKPLILLTEKQGLPSIVVCNDNVDVEFVDDLDSFYKVMDALLGGKKDGDDYMVNLNGEEIRCQTVVLDSLSDLHERIKRSYQDKYGDLNFKHWGSIQDDIRMILDDLRSLPVNLVCLSMAQEEMDNNQQRRIRPMIYGRIGDVIGQWFSGVGYAGRNEIDGKIKYTIKWSSGKIFDTKKAPGFPDQIINNVLENKTEISLGTLIDQVFNKGDKL